MPKVYRSMFGDNELPRIGRGSNVLGLSSTAFDSYETLLKRLHEMIADGQGDSDPANTIREAMEIPERALNQQELDRLDGLSADLFMLTNRELLEAATDDVSPQQRLLNLRNAFDHEDWEKALSLLRNQALADIVAEEHRAYFRAIAYEGAGQIDTARLFMQCAAQLRPHDISYAYLALDYLARTDTNLSNPAGLQNVPRGIVAGAYATLALCLIEAYGDVNAARESARQARLIYPEDINLHAQLGNAIRIFAQLAGNGQPTISNFAVPQVPQLSLRQSSNFATAKNQDVWSSLAEEVGVRL